MLCYIFSICSNQITQMTTNYFSQDQRSICRGGGGVWGGLTPHWLKMTPTLVTENFCLGCRLRPPSLPVPIQQDQHNVQMISKYTVLFIPILN